MDSILDFILGSIFGRFLLPTSTPENQLNASRLAFSCFSAFKVDINFGSHFGINFGAKLAFGGPWGLLGATWAPGALSRGPLRPKKTIAIFRGGSREISQRDFTLPGGPLWRPWGSFCTSFWRLVWKTAKFSICKQFKRKP